MPSTLVRSAIGSIQTSTCASTATGTGARRST